MLKHRYWLWLSLGFTIFAVMSATVWLMVSGGNFDAESILKIYIPEVIFWNVWILVAPVIFWISRRFSYSISPFSWKWAIHVPLALIVSAGSYALYLLMTMALFKLSALAGLTEGGTVMQEIQWRIRGLLGIGVPLGAIFYGLLVVLYHVQDYNQRLREEKHRTAVLKGELAQAELQALKMQLHPHFLFNSLNTISSTLQTDPKMADNMLAQLGDFLRITLENVDKSLVSLEEEIDFVRKYLQIEQHRFEDRLIIEYDIAQDVSHASVPYLIMQPLIENAIQHGVGQSLGASRISISAYKQGDTLCIDLFNTGSHLSTSSSDINFGIGLSNTHSRLQQLYGNQGVLTIENVPDGGVLASLQLPFSHI